MSNPTYASASTSIDGRTVYVIFTADSLPLLPAATNTPGFQIKLNSGSYESVVYAQRVGAAGNDSRTWALTAPTRVTLGDTVLVSYTPGTPAITDSASNAANTFSDETVTNNAVERNPFINAADGSCTTDHSGYLIDLDFEALSGTELLPATGNIDGFTVTDNLTPITVAYATRLGNTGADLKKIRLTLNSQMTAGDSIVISYSPGSTIITDNDSPPNQLLTFNRTLFSDENIVSERIPPTLATAVSSVDGGSIVLGFSETVLPAAGNILGWSAFQGSSQNIALDVTAATRTASNQITLTLGTKITYGAGVTKVYYAPPTNSADVTDNASIPNKLAAITGFALTTDNTVERIQPVITASGLAIDSTGNYIVVPITEADGDSLETSDSNPITGFTVTVNGVAMDYIAAIVGLSIHLTIATPLINIGDCESLLTVAYHAGNVQDSNGNALTNLVASPVSMANMTDDGQPTFQWAETSIDGYHVYVKLWENRTPPIRSGDNSSDRVFQGFSVFVNGAKYDIVQAERKSITPSSPPVADDTIVDIELYYRIRPGDNVEVVYFDDGSITKFVQDNSPANNRLANFVTNNVTIQSSIDPVGWFSPLAWLNDNTLPLPIGDLYERRVGWPDASLVVDIHPPIGDVILNEDPGTGGAAVHYFEAFATSDTENTGSGETDIADSTSWFAIKFLSSGQQTITALGLQLKIATADPRYEQYNVSLYSDNGDKPGNLLVASATPIFFNSIPLTYNASPFQLPLSTVLAANTHYWIVVTRTATPAYTVSYPAYVDTTGDLSLATSTDGITWTVTHGLTGYYKLFALNANAVPLASYNELQDALHNSLGEALNFGGAAEPNVYEAIGTNNVRSIVKYITPNLDGSYPSCAAVQVGVTASTPKAYIVDVMTATNSAWQPLFYMIADNIFRSYVNFTFKTEQKIQVMRIRYRGDYYAISNTASVTVSAFDPITPVTAIQLAHDSGYVDAPTIAGADSEGWIPFTEGTSTLGWNLVNLDRFWTLESTPVSDQFIGVIQFGLGLVLFSNTKIYVYANGTLSVAYTTGNSAINITSWTIFNNKLYVGLSNGQIIVSATGNNWTNFIAVSKSVDSLTVFQSQLWIGMARSSDNFSKLYSYNPTLSLLTLQKAFNEDTVSALANVGGYLFAGSAGTLGFGAATVYVYDGTTWSTTLQTTSDSIDALTYSTANGNLWAGLRGGVVCQLSFTNGAPTAWKTAYQGDNNRFFAISDDPSGAHMWLHTDSGLISFVESTGAYPSVTSLAPTINGLVSTWSNGTSDNYRNPGYGVSHVYATSNLPSAFGIPSGIAGHFNTVWEGFIVCPYSELVTLSLTATCDGVNIWIDGVEVFNEWTVGLSALSSTSYYTFKANTPVSFKMTMAGQSSTAAISLQWASVSLGAATAIPSSAFLMPVSSTGLAYFGSKPYVSFRNGGLYLLDPTSIGTTTRSVYARFKDAVGNYDNAGLSDNIIQDYETINGVRVTSGTIYQVSTDKNIVTTFVSPVASQLRAPDRQVRQSGIYQSNPFYAPTLSRWDIISFVAELAAGNASPGLDRGVEVELYVKTGTTMANCLAAAWGTPYKQTTINNPSNAGLIDTNLIGTGEFDISTLQNPWLQFQLVLTTASKNESPIVRAVTLTYKAAQASYFFSTMFNTNPSNNPNPPTFRRFLLTSNEVENGGQITWGYTTDATAGNTFDWSKFTPITPNMVEEIASPGTEIRIGAQLVSVMAANTPSSITVAPTPCDVATTQSITLNGPQTVDGIVMTSGRVLVKNQITASENGIYDVVPSGPWTLAADTLSVGYLVPVASGVQNGMSSFVCTVTSPPTFIQYTCTIIDNYGVQFDVGSADLKFMS